jgi:MGT family glycosyltransferase
MDWDASKTEEFFPGFLRARAQSQGRLLASLAGEGMVDDLLELAEDWRPDVIVRDASEFGAIILGAILDIPVAVVGIGLRAPLEWIVRALGPTLAAVRQKYGLPTRDPAEDLMGRLWLSSFPPAFGFAGDVIPHERHMRAVVPESLSDESTPDWLDQVGDRAVYVTLGTVFNGNQDLLRLLAESLASAGLGVILTTGSNVDPRSLGTLPNNVHVAPYVTQSRLSPHVRAVVSHGGFNTVMGALSDGLPVCCVPLSADHPFNASRCVDLGLGTAVTTWTPPWGPPTANPKDVTPSLVVDAVMPLIDDAMYRDRTTAMAAELQRMPGPVEASMWIEELAPGS